MTYSQALLGMCVALTLITVYLIIKVRSLEAQIWRSPPRERYTRASVTVGKTQVDAGLEWRENDPPIVGHDLWQICNSVGSRVRFVTPMQAVIDHEPDLDDKWPDRAWFVEIGDADGCAYVQVFQPFGMPRWRYRNKRGWGAIPADKGVS